MILTDIDNNRPEWKINDIRDTEKWGFNSLMGELSPFFIFCINLNRKLCLKQTSALVLVLLLKHLKQPSFQVPKDWSGGYFFSRGCEKGETRPPVLNLGKPMYVLWQSFQRSLKAKPS